MRISARAVLISTAISLAYGSFVFACPMWTRDLGLDVWNVLEDEARVCANRAEHDRLQAMGDRVKKRLSLKLLITEELLDRRIALADAADQFLSLNRIEPDQTTIMRSYFPSASEEESAARQVLAHVRSHLNSDSGDAKQIVRRLEDELAEIGRRHKP